MDRRQFSLRMYMQRRRYRIKRIHKSWVGFGTGLRAVMADLFIVFQLLCMVIVYAILVNLFTIFFYVCLGLTAVAAVYVGVWERDIQAKISWILLFLISFGCGFLIYILAAKPISYGVGRIRFKKISKRIEYPVSDFRRGEIESEATPAGSAQGAVEFAPDGNLSVSGGFAPHWNLNFAGEIAPAAGESVSVVEVSPAAEEIACGGEVLPVTEESARGGEIAPVAEYLERNGFPVFGGTQGRYYSNARAVLDNMIARIDGAEKFVFLEFFIVADGVLLNRLVSIFRRKSAEGVQIFMLYDAVGSAGVFSEFMKKTLRDAGVKLKAFSKLTRPFYFGLNFRDHRKIVVVDGKTGYIGGYNLIDDCANLRNMEGVWKDCGLRLDGAAVDGLSVMFMRQWELATRQKLDAGKYINNYDRADNKSFYIPYAGGPEITAHICRGVYSQIIEGARERLYIMTPYLIPDTGVKKQLIKKAKEGVDVRIVLPDVPDYRYVYRVTTSNARRLLKKGIKIYYAGGEFVHSKVMLSESVAAVGSVNMDMRAFYQEFDNGAVTDDGEVLRAIAEDFEWQFTRNAPAKSEKINPVSAVIAAVLRLVSPLM